MPSRGSVIVLTAWTMAPPPVMADTFIVMEHAVASNGGHRNAASEWYVAEAGPVKGCVCQAVPVPPVPTTFSHQFPSQASTPLMRASDVAAVESHGYSGAASFWAFSNRFRAYLNVAP